MKALFVIVADFFFISQTRFLCGWMCQRMNSPTLVLIGYVPRRSDWMVESIFFKKRIKCYYRDFAFCWQTNPLNVWIMSTPPSTHTLLNSIVVLKKYGNDTKQGLSMSRTIMTVPLWEEFRNNRTV